MDKSKLIAIAVWLILFSGCTKDTSLVITPVEAPETAKRNLSIGNQRFASGHTLNRDIQTIRNRLTTEQNPYAVVLSCSDSRVSPELIFDQTLGEL
jgi:carbonic anhydrase